jgi:hypothetical protein
MYSTSSIGEETAILSKYPVVLAHISNEARNMELRRLEQLMKGSTNVWIGFLKSFPFSDQSYLDDDAFLAVSKNAISRGIYASRIDEERTPCVC